MTFATKEALRKYSLLDADASAAVLTNALLMRTPFVFVRYGDGALEAINGRQGMTCDHERYTRQLGIALQHAWDTFMRAEQVLVFAGDWLSSSFSGPDDPSIYEKEFRRLVGKYAPIFLHPECLLLMRESQALVDFYQAVKADPRRKLFMGPMENYGAAKMLGAAHLPTPMVHDLLSHCGWLADWLIAQDFDILLWGAGMASSVAVAKCFERHPERTYINIGSAMDPLFRGRSRRTQLSREIARNLFRELL